jgi:hypothetical protein
LGSVIVRAEARTYLRGKGNSKDNSNRKEDADPCGMTARKATAKTTATAKKM